MVSEIEYKNNRKLFLSNNNIDIVSLFVFGEFLEADIVHHARGRKNNLNNIDTFIATTHIGDKWIHDNENIAKELGFICK